MAIVAGSAALAAYLAVTAVRIERQSAVDEAQSADVIMVLGAAEYNGRPSPVLRARLDHALDLYRQKLAPCILTTGGAGGDRLYTEGGVGRTYLIARGVPADSIIVENEGDSTMTSVARSGEILSRMGLHSVIVASDGYHIYRVKKILESRGFTVFGSPRKESGRTPIRDQWNCFKQAIGYVLWRAGVAV
jgi:vancomycin permeability regulator SanA